MGLDPTRWISIPSHSASQPACAHVSVSRVVVAHSISCLMQSASAATRRARRDARHALVVLSRLVAQAANKGATRPPASGRDSEICLHPLLLRNGNGSVVESRGGDCRKNRRNHTATTRFAYKVVPARLFACVQRSAGCARQVSVRSVRTSVFVCIGCIQCALRRAC